MNIYLDPFNKTDLSQEICYQYCSNYLSIRSYYFHRIKRLLHTFDTLIHTLATRPKLLRSHQLHLLFRRSCSFFAAAAYGLEWIFCTKKRGWTVMSYFQLNSFPPWTFQKLEFTTREDLIPIVKEYASEQRYALVIKRSKPGKAWIKCD